MIEVCFDVHDSSAYDSAMEIARASPGWLEMTIIDCEPWDDGDAIAEIRAWFDTEAHAMLFRLRLGV